MPTVSDIAAFLEAFAPLRLAADWDNVGLLIGDANRSVSRVMTCLTVTPATVAEAIADHANLIVTHHPFPFEAMRRLTNDTVEGRLLLDLVAAGIAVYSPHTAFDSAAAGVNHQLCEGLQLTEIAPLIADADDPWIGTGRMGRTALGTTLEMLAQRAACFLKVESLQLVTTSAGLDPCDLVVNRVGVACGSAGDLLTTARERNCDCFVTGEARFHTCLAAQASGIPLLLVGHYASERFAVEQLAGVLAQRFVGLHIWPSQTERDPLTWWQQ